MITFGSGLVSNSRWSVLLESTAMKLVGEYNDYYFSDHVGTSWIHVAMVYDGATLSLYEDGVLVDTASVTTPFATDNSYDLIFGADSLDRADEYLDGDLRDIRAWNRALSESEVAAELTSGAADPTDLIGHWPLDEGTGTTVADASGNGHDGTIYGATWTGCAP
jgi:hypothetical protein